MIYATIEIPVTDPALVMSAAYAFGYKNFNEALRDAWESFRDGELELEVEVVLSEDAPDWSVGYPGDYEVESVVDKRTGKEITSFESWQIIELAC